MPYSDFTVDPPITILHQHEVNELPLLKEAPIGESNSDFGEEFKVVGPKYNYGDLYNHTKRMMALLMINYDKPKNCPKLENIPEHIKIQLKPFAHFLAIIDGNAFEGTIDQYITDVYSIMTFGGHSFIDETLEKVLDSRLEK